MPITSSAWDARRPIVLRITANTSVITTAVQAAAERTPSTCMPRKWRPPPKKTPFMVDVPVANRPVRTVPSAPHTPCTEIAPTGSSIFTTWSKNSTEKTTANPQTIPMIAAPNGLTASHPAVIPTRPARDALNVMETSGFPYFTQVKIMVVSVASAAARFVLKNTRPALTISSSLSMPTVEAPLNPNQQNHRINTPRAAMDRLCPGIARGFPSFPYLPMRGPSIFAPIRAHTPPTICTAVDPAKS